MKTSIKINDQYIQKILLGSTPVQRIYQSGSIVYDTGVKPTPQPCFEVVSTISQASGNYVDVYVKGESKWYKKNNLNQYEEYGLMPTVTDLSSTTYYTGKLVILSTDSHEYKWNGSEWIDLGNAGTFTYYIFIDPAESSSQNVQYTFKYYFANDFKMKILFYLTPNYSYYDDFSVVSYKQSNVTGYATAPIEFSFYSNGFYLDSHYPISGYNGKYYDAVDYNNRVMQESVLNSYKGKMLIAEIRFNKVTLYDFESGAVIGTYGSNYTSSTWGTELSANELIIESFLRLDYGSGKHPAHLGYIQVYDKNDNMVNDIRFVPDENQKIYIHDSIAAQDYTSPSTLSFNYHTESIGELTPPVDYDTKVAPSDNVHYNTLAELELMECPWIGMIATVGQDYTLYVYTEDGWVPGEIPLDLPYLRFTALEDTTFTFTKSSLAAADLEVKYSIDGGVWNTMESGVATPIVKSGSYVLLKSNFHGVTGNKVANGTFSSTGNFELTGNSMSLIYGDEFENQLSLKGKTSVFHSLFKNCTKLKSVSNSVLPSTTLDNYVYSSLFKGCTGLTSIPEGLLPSTELTVGCYYEMFRSSGLKSIPEGLLPSTELKVLCYGYMFAKSEVASIPPNLLPSTKIEISCYSGLFQYTKITSIPSGLLPSTELKNSCYSGMFMGCESLKSANIELPATTVNNGYEYYFMFYNCINLTDPPIIKATSVSGNKAFHEMFYGCSKMKYLVCDMLNEPSSSISQDWLNGVSETGTFYKNPDATWDQTITKGNDTVPTGWNIVNSDVEPNYLTFTVVDPNGSTFKFNNSSTEYSIDNGTWTPLDRNTDSPLVQENSSIRFRGTITPSGSDSQRLQITSSGKFNVSGNILTLLYGANYREGKISKADVSYVFYRMFYNNTNVVDAGSLILPVFSKAPDYGFKEMFRGCTNLTTSPVMKADTTGRYSFRDVFNGCTSLTTVNEIYCGNTNTESHVSMFQGCTSLISVPNINVTTTFGWSIQWMFHSCTSLQDVVLKGNISEPYSSEMLFSGCTSLTSVTYLGSQKPAKDYTTNWMADVPENGTFYMNKNYSWDSTVSRDANGIPASWTIVKVDPNNYQQ